ncbi:hypothetical protein GN956_G15144 [Arapaima gigas]
MLVTGGRGSSRFVDCGGTRRLAIGWHFGARRASDRRFPDSATDLLLVICLLPRPEQQSEGDKRRDAGGACRSAW